MKKILTASLVAMMAVTAANAEIASTTYVSDQTGSTVAFKAGDFGTGIAKDATNLKAAVTAISDAVAGLSGDGTGSVSEQIDSALSGATADDFSESVQGSLSKADNSVQKNDFDTFKSDNTQAIANAKQDAITTADTNADSKINALDVAKKTATEGTYFGAYEQVDGKISMTEKAFDTGIVEDEQGKYSNNAPSAAAVADYVAAELKASSDKLDVTIADAKQTASDALNIANANADDIADLKTADTTMGGRVSTLENTVEQNRKAADATQTELTNYKSTNDKALSDYKAEAAETFMDSTEVGAAITAAVTNSETGVLKNYSTTEQMNASIAEAKGEAIADAKAETTTQVNALKDGAVKTNTDNISTITTNLGALNGVVIPDACGSGRCALVMEGGEAKWETINY